MPMSIRKNFDSSPIIPWNRNDNENRIFNPWGKSHPKKKSQFWGFKILKRKKVWDLNSEKSPTF